MAEKLVFLNTPNMKKWLTDIESLNKRGLEEAVTAALIESKKYITELLEAEMQNHIRTGITLESLDTEQKVNVNGFKYSIPVGFHIREGGLASIFLMHGTPRQAPDQRLYDAVYGRGTRTRVMQIQQEQVKRVLQKYLGDMLK